MAVSLTAFARHLWRVGPRPPALVVTAACLLVPGATADQFALVSGWW